MPQGHALLSCSKSNIFLNCTPSLLLEQRVAETESVYEAEGTFCHLLSEYKLKQKVHQRCERPVSEYDTAETEKMTDETSDYAYERYKIFKRFDKNAEIFIEHQVSLEKFVKECWGTADVILVRKGFLEIIDNKFGFISVAPTSYQLRLYALGGLVEFMDEYKIKKVRMTIIQPRLQNLNFIEMTVNQLMKWAKTVFIPNARKAYLGEGELKSGDWCRWCNCKSRCTKYAEEALKIAKMEFRQPDLLGDDDLAYVLKNYQETKRWLDDVWEYATQEAIKGKCWNGLKLVEGKSNRKYKNEKLVEEACKQAGFKDIYRLITITEMERMMTKPVFNRVLGDLVEKPAGKLTLVTEDDPRPAITNVNTEFKKEN